MIGEMSNLNATISKYYDMSMEKIIRSIDIIEIFDINWKKIP